MDDGAANKISIAFVVFFAANALINLIAIITESSFSRDDLIDCILYALVSCVVCAIPLLLKNTKDIVLTLIIVAIGIFKTFGSGVGDVSGMSLVITGIFYYIVRHGVSYKLLFLLFLSSLIVVTYAVSKNSYGVTWLSNSFLYIGFAVYIRKTVYGISFIKNKEFTEDQLYIIKQLEEGKQSKQIYPNLNISLPQYNRIKDKLREQTGTLTDAHLIAWCKDRKII